MRQYITLLLILINSLCFAQGFNVVCSDDTIRGNHGGYEYDDSLMFCAYNLSSNSYSLPKRVLEINDSIVNKNFIGFLKKNEVQIRDYLIVENEKFETIKSNGKGWISLERCAQEVKYAIRYEIWIYGNIRYFLSFHYDSSFNCLNFSTVANFCNYFDKNQMKDFCTIKEHAENDLSYRGKVNEVTFSFDNNRSVWIFGKDGPPPNRKTLKGYDYILIYDALTGKLLKRSKEYYQSCQPCPAFK